MLGHVELRLAPLAAGEAVGQHEDGAARALDALRDVRVDGARRQPVPADCKDFLLFCTHHAGGWYPLLHNVVCSVQRPLNRVNVCLVCWTVSLRARRSSPLLCAKGPRSPWIQSTSCRSSVVVASITERPFLSACIFPAEIRFTPRVIVLFTWSGGRA